MKAAQAQGSSGAGAGARSADGSAEDASSSADIGPAGPPAGIKKGRFEGVV